MPRPILQFCHDGLSDLPNRPLPERFSFLSWGAGAYNVSDRPPTLVNLAKISPRGMIFVELGVSPESS